MCGHVYESPHRRGRVRRYGDCDCSMLGDQDASFHQTCIRCGDSFWWIKDREYCSGRCRQAIRRRRALGVPVGDRMPDCERCGRPIAGAQRVDRKRCDACAGKATPFMDDRECRVCGGLFTPFKVSQKSCSNRCAQRWYKANHRKPDTWDERRKANYQRRRARKMEVPADSIRFSDIFERDKWACGICGQLVDSSARWPEPGSPSLDHIVPLSKGGHHIESNVQLAHLECNISKGDRVLAA